MLSNNQILKLLLLDVQYWSNVNHKTQSSSWLPPRENWDPGNTGLPYGWEGAVDKNNKPYFINHVENYTTRDDPRDDPDYMEPPKPREVELERDSHKGFGFVAGSEKPVVVRFVTEGGPSVDKLLPGDQVIKINGQDVKKAPREYVIDLVRSCKQSITLTVCQPYNDNSFRKSALLTAAKKDRLKKNPSRVRFAEEIIVNGASMPSDSPEDSCVAFMPNVLKVFLENGQTKSFKYDNKTTVKDVVNSLQEKLNLKCVQHFNLVLHNAKSHMPGRMTLLQEHEAITEIASRPGARHFRCMFRVAYVPRDSYDLLKQDPIAFEYFYMQCVNDVVQERFAAELKPDAILRLSALHIQQHATSNNVGGKINIKAIEKECGLEKFVPQSVRDSMRTKDLRKVLTQSLKVNQSLTAPGQKQLTALQAKLHYMKIVSELKTFGSRVFMVTLLDRKTEAMVLVGPKAGISLVTNIRFYTLSMLADFSEIQSVKVTREQDNMNRVELSIKGEEPGTLNLGLLKDDAMNFVSMVNGYYKIFVDPNKSLLQKIASRQSEDPEIPPYEGKHIVITAPWSYPEDIVSMVIGEDASNQGNGFPDNERVVDLTRGPPSYEGNTEFISKLKQDLGIKSDEDKMETENKENITNSSYTKSTGVTALPVEIPESPMLKTIINVESDHRPQNPSDVQVDKDSIMSNSLASVSVVSDSDDSKLHDGGLQPTDAKKIKRSPTPYADNHEAEMDVEEIEYVNASISSNKKLEYGENNSDTDSGVGGEADRQIFIVQNSIPELTDNKDQIAAGTDDTGSPDVQVDGSAGSIGTGTSLAQLTDLHLDLHLDLRGLKTSEFGLDGAQGSPTSTASPDPESTSFTSPFDPEQLPAEIIAGMYDPRMFYHNQELYIDPDIIDLTLLPPYPPTVEELAEMADDAGVAPLPPSPQVTAQRHRAASPRHPPMHRYNSILDGEPSPKEEFPSHGHPVLQKSASVGYCPDFLDSDIDSIIDKLTVQPPPDGSTIPNGEVNVNTEGGVNYSESIEGGVNNISESDRLAHSWNGPMGESEGGMEFGDMDMSKTIDLGEFALDEEYFALILPPPPDESATIEDNDIRIVPPISTVKERRKTFESKKIMSTETYQKLFGTKVESKDRIKELTGDKTSVSDKQTSRTDSKDTVIDPTYVNVPSPRKVIDKGEPATSVSVDKGSAENESPASVSEKLNDLLKSLSSYDPLDKMGNIRGTSSLRLGRCSSLDFLPDTTTHSSNASNALMTGSVRLRPKVRVRPGLSLDRQFIPSTDPSSSVNKPDVIDRQNDRLSDDNKFSHIKRTHSYDVLSSASESKSMDNDTENKPSESFQALKAKLQSYRDTLLRRSLRGRKTNSSGSSDQVSSSEADTNKQKPLMRSNSFTQLIRRSLRRTSNDNKKEDRRSLSATSTKDRADVKDPSPSPVSSARDKKIWNTLSTPRQNFRPSASMSSTQEDLSIDTPPEARHTFPVKIKERLAAKRPIPSPKPAIPSSKPAITSPKPAIKSPKPAITSPKPAITSPKPPIPVPKPSTPTLPADQGEAKKQKAGPMKALSDVFDSQASSEPSNMNSTRKEKSPKKMAPDIPTSAPPLPSSPPPTELSDKSLVEVLASRPALKSALSSQAMRPNAPPRRKHLSSSDLTQTNHLSLVEKKSKDDSELKLTSAPKSTVYASPFATVGKMWRPMSMTSNATKDSDVEDTYRTYNNFDALRDMAVSSVSSRLMTKQPSGNTVQASKVQTDKIPNGHIEGAGATLVFTSSTGVVATAREPVTSVSEESFAVLREWVSDSHSNSVKQILEKVYTSEDFGQAMNDVERLLTELKQTVESLKSSRIDKKTNQFSMCKDELQSQVRQFVTDAKLLVSNATQTKQKLAANMDTSMHSLAKIFLHGQATMFMMEVIHQAQHLGSEIMRVANAYKSTLNAAHAAVGKPLADPHMKYLMRQATNLATLLSNLLKSLKMLRNR